MAMNMRILIFDTETGGVNAEENDILQLSYQVIDGRTFDVVKEVNHFFDLRSSSFAPQQFKQA